MKSYKDTVLKRKIQYYLWTDIARCKNILALSSPDYIVQYKLTLPKCDNLFLVNFAPNDELINTNSLLGLFDILCYRKIYPDFIDADFCKTIKSCGDDLIYLYNKCKKLNKDVIISFTFSIRGVGLNPTLMWLKDNFNININNEGHILQDSCKYRQFVIKYGNCLYYRDSGDQMVTGLIKINKV